MSARILLELEQIAKNCKNSEIAAIANDAIEEIKFQEKLVQVLSNNIKKLEEKAYQRGIEDCRNS